MVFQHHGFANQSMIIINLPAVAMLAIAFGIAWGLGALTGNSAESQMMMIAGPLCVAVDLVYRWKVGDRRWFAPGAGGALFFIPIWMFGIFWFVLGIVRIAQGRS